MHCPACHKENPAGATVCEFCRTPLLDPASGLQQTVPVSGVSVGDARFEQGRLIAGRYLVERELGRGGMGVVYLVRDQQLRGKEVALKLISAELTASPQGRDRFIQEVLATQELQHPNIIRVFHLDEAARQCFFTMEYVPGNSLRDVVEGRKKSGSTFTLKESVSVLKPVLEALNHAHTQSPPVVHRDIKPDNIMVTGDLSSPQVKVLDFGLAKMLSPSRLTTTAMTMGTAYYMAPEQVQGGRDIDQRADLFSAGVVLYEMLTGRIPSGRFKLPTELNRELPAAVDVIVDRVLQQEPADRYASAREMGSALESAVRSAAEEETTRKKREAGEAVEPRSEAHRMAPEEVRLKVETETSQKEAESKRNKMVWAAAGVFLAMLAFFVWKGSDKPVGTSQTVTPPPVTASAAKKYLLTIRPEPPDANVEFLNSSMIYRPSMEVEPGTYRMQVSRKGYLPKGYDAVIKDRDILADIRLVEEEPVSPVPPSSKYSLTIRTDPADATVTFTDSSLHYRPGMKLGVGVYEVAVSKDGYSSRRQKIRINDRDEVADVGLSPLYALTIRPEPGDAVVEFVNSSMTYRPGMEIEPGKYGMRISREGYLAKRYDVLIQNRDLMADVRLEEEEPSASAPSPSEYSLTIQTDPANATVTFTTSSLQYRPGMKLVAGTYEVEISKDGYSPKRQQVQIADRDVVSNVRLTPLYALTIQPTPADAQVKILNIKPKYQDGMNVEPGQYKIEVSKPGHETYLGTVDVVDKDVFITAELEKEVEKHQVFANTTLNASETFHFSELTKEQGTVQDPFVASTPVEPHPAAVPASPIVLSKGDTWRDPVTGMEFVWVAGGCYQMGSNDGEDNERPVHEVCVDGFWMGRYEVTNEQYRRYKPNHNSGDFKRYSLNAGKQPAVNVSWDDAASYASWLSSQGNEKYRLPKEAEWEYAARSKGRSDKYAGSTDLYKIAWYTNNSGKTISGISKRTNQVGTKDPNYIGLYDMSGNVQEWCEDNYDVLAYSKHSHNNPININGGSERVIRGGGYKDAANSLRTTHRRKYMESKRSDDIGFRLVRED